MSKHTIVLHDSIKFSFFFFFMIQIPQKFWNLNMWLSNIYEIMTRSG